MDSEDFTDYLNEYLYRSQKLSALITKMRSVLPATQPLAYAEIVPWDKPEEGKTIRTKEKVPIKEIPPLKINGKKEVCGFSLHIMNLVSIGAKALVFCCIKDKPYFGKDFFYPVLRFLPDRILKENLLKGLILGDLAVFDFDYFNKAVTVTDTEFLTEQTVFFSEVRLAITADKNLQRERWAREFVSIMLQEKKRLNLEDEEVFVNFKLPTDFQSAWMEYQCLIYNELDAIWQNLATPMEIEVERRTIRFNMVKTC